MHESGLVEELIAEIERVALNNSGGKIARVEIGIGALAGFTQQHFEEHFRTASTDTLAQDAVLVIHSGEGDALTLEAVEIEDQ